MTNRAEFRPTDHSLKLARPLWRFDCRKGLALAVAASFSGWLTGCCTPPPRAEKYFDRSIDPVNCFRMFQYAIEVRQFEVAHQCLTAKSREEIKLDLLPYLRKLRFENYPCNAYEVIVNAEWFGDLRMNSEETAAAMLVFHRWQRGSTEFQFLFEKVDSEWLIDLLAMSAGVPQ
ncbi:MAG: hypothetical protein ACKVX7_02415 [Planctomycetota bacterium]